MNSSKRNQITCGTKEWADHNINCCLGCYNDCRYCYVKKMAKRFSRATEETWKSMKVNLKALNKSYTHMRGRCMFPTSHDIINLPVVEEACFITLRKLLEKGNEVLITTKPRISVITKIDELFSRFKDQMQFRFTVTSIDDDMLKFWEPNAPLFQKRLICLKLASYRGYKTSVSIEPFFDYNPEYFVKEVDPYCTEFIWIGKMNYIPRNGMDKNEVSFYSSIRKNYEIAHLIEIYRKLKCHPKIRFKDSIMIALVLHWAGKLERNFLEKHHCIDTVAS